jgi:hypothetical protein
MDEISMRGNLIYAYYFTKKNILKVIMICINEFYELDND